MKKWLLIAGAVAIAGVIYFLIPFERTLSDSLIGLRTIGAVTRCFNDTGRWKEWWPKNSGSGFEISKLSYDNAQVILRWGSNHQLSGNLRVAPLNGDSVLIRWEGPVSRQDAGEGRRRVDAVLASFKAYIEDAKRLYGVNFYRTMSSDSTLVVIISKSSAYPGVPEIYRKIDSLRRYIAAEGAREMNPPMLNVTRLNDSTYRTTVAISVNRTLPAKGDILPKRFVPWKMLEGEVHGGEYTVEKAFKEMQHFKQDYNLQIMAIPYQSLMTDRRQEPDTAKWVTIVCAPIS